MHAVVTRVSIEDTESAQATLRDEIVPRIAQTPGFVAGYWVSVSDGKGSGITVWESEDAARAAADQIQPPPNVSFDSVEVGEVVANA
jgi:hypothetical protein